MTKVENIESLINPENSTIGEIIVKYTPGHYEILYDEITTNLYYIFVNILFILFLAHEF